MYHSGHWPPCGQVLPVHLESAQVGALSTYMSSNKLFDSRAYRKVLCRRRSSVHAIIKEVVDNVYVTIIFRRKKISDVEIHLFH